jgi:3-keto-L-gulonate-6-phosphate decarboxylase
MFYDAGADLVTVLASASPNTVAAAADAAAAWGRSLVLDTVGLDDPITWLRSRSIPEGVSHIAIHSSLDDRSKPDFDETAQFKLVAEAAQLGRRVVLAGGITRKTFDHAVQSGADVIVVGREIWGSPNPAEVARMMKESTR